MTRRHRIGAAVTADGNVSFCVWAPRRARVEVVIEGPIGTEKRVQALEPVGEGYFQGSVPGLGAGALYRYRLDGDGPFPDPASRFQPDGPHGASMVVDPAGYSWHDAGWRGVERVGQVLYEMHIGTFTPEGTWRAAERELPALADVGVTVLEVMPVAEFPGRFGWGYDGVCLFAPTRLYGTPDDFRRFVDRAHALGLGVILDVVYNHFGPDGNYLREFSPEYFTDRYENEWGDALNFDGPGSRAVRDFFVANACSWVEEYHLDGLRLDATQQIFDSSSEHILAEMGRTLRAATPDRSLFLVGENEPQDRKLVLPEAEGGYGLDALWNDDFHHSAKVALTGRREAYYLDYCGTPQELISAIRWGYLYQGQRYAWQKKRRGTPALDLPATSFVHYLENHDQIANSERGLRLSQLTAPGLYRAMTAVLLLAPATPMLFQGQEFAASSPFLYFADHDPELAEKVREGRTEFLSQFPSIATEAMRAQLADPADPETFRRSKLDPAERERNTAAYALHRDLLRIRREDEVIAAQRSDRLHGAVLSGSAFLLRYFGEDGDDRLLVVNLGPDLRLDILPEPLLAPPSELAWQIAWSSEDPRYSGGGSPEVETDEGWRVPAHSATLLAGQRRTEAA